MSDEVEEAEGNEGESTFELVTPSNPVTTVELVAGGVSVSVRADGEDYVALLRDALQAHEALLKDSKRSGLGFAAGSGGQFDLAPEEVEGGDEDE